jgi:hypothetical protein
MQPGLPVRWMPVQPAGPFPVYPAVGYQRAVERQAQLATVGVPGEHEFVTVGGELVK